MKKSNYKRILGVVILGLVATYAYAEVIKPSFTTDAMKANSVATDSLTNKSGSGSPNFPFGATGITADSPNEITNLIDNQNGVTGLINAQPNQVQDWIDTGVGMVSSVTTTTSEIALYPSELTGIKLTLAAGTNDYTQVRFLMPPALHNYKLALDWVQKVSGYSASGAKVEVWRNAAADYSGAYSEVALSADDSSGDSFIPNSTSLYTGNTFDTDNSSYYELRFVNAGGSAGYISINEIAVGYRRAATGAIVTDWEDFTPVSTWVANTTTSGRWRRVGTDMEIEYLLETSNTPTVTDLRLTIPDNKTIDSGHLSTTIRDGYTSSGMIWDQTASDTWGVVATYDNSGFTTGNKSFYVMFLSDTISSNNYVDDSAPMPFGVSDKITMFVKVPIAEWAGSGVANLGTNDVEYAYNSSTTVDVDDTTSLEHGPLGANFLAHTTNTNFTAEFQSDIGPTDRVTLQIDVDGSGKWIDFSGSIQQTSGHVIEAWNIQTSVFYGISIRNTVAVNNKQVRVRFGDYAAQNNSGAYASAGWAWSTVSGSKWRVKKTRAGAASGFGLATSTKSGLVLPKNMPGTDTNDSADVGNVGEYIEVTGSFSAPATGAYSVSSGITLTPGDWDLVFTFVSVNDASATTEGAMISLSTGTSTATQQAVSSLTVAQFSTNNLRGGSGSVFYRATLTANTTYYGKVIAYNSAYTNAVPYQIFARRVR